MRQAVIDASVAVQWAVAEEHSCQADSLLRNYELHAPAHWLSEAVHVLWVKTTRQFLTQEQALARVVALQRVNLRTHSLASLTEKALSLSMTCHVSVYDSLYVALALAQNVPLVTADRKLIRKLADARVADGLVVWVGAIAPT